MILRVLIAGAEPGFSRKLRDGLGELDLELLLREVEDVADLWTRLRREPFDMLMIQGKLLGDDRTATLEGVRALPEAPEVVLFVRGDDPAFHAEDLAAGALAVLDDSVEGAPLVEALRALVERSHSQAVAELRADESERESRLSDFSSGSPAMRQFLATVRKVVNTDSSLLILGETGVGKEYLARAIFAESHRSEGPFVAVNCAALPETLLESELFGHVEGAFTGAQRARRGYFELAHGGTVFLDEIGELAPHLQVKLLRVLQEREIQPVGSEQSMKVNVRLLAATNRDLKEEMEAGRFRADLYYRLSVVTLTVPPLRERREDIPKLVESHTEHFARTMNRPVYEVTPDAMSLLTRHGWPGNVRELINVVERAVLLASHEQIDVSDLPEEIQAAGSVESAIVGDTLAGPGTAPVDLCSKTYREARDELLDVFERRYFDELLRRTKGRVGEAANAAGITSRSLYEKMKRLGLRKETYRSREDLATRS